MSYSRDAAFAAMMLAGNTVPGRCRCQYRISPRSGFCSTKTSTLPVVDRRVSGNTAVAGYLSA
jgi:hypothetical protein